MPFVDDNGRSARPTTDSWRIAFKNAFSRRLPAEQLIEPLRKLSERQLTSPEHIADILVSFRGRGNDADDPLLFSYAHVLLQSNLIGAASLLLALLRSSHFVPGAAASTSGKARTGLPTCEERMFNMLTQVYIPGEPSYGVPDVQGIVNAIIRWMHAVTEYEQSKQLEGGAAHTADVFSFSMYEALASLALIVLSTAALRDAAKRSWFKKRRIVMVQEMENFDTHILQWMQSQLAGRLRGLAALPPFFETDEKGLPVLADAQVLQSIQDLPIVNTRAGLYIWLNACLCARPLTDDLSMLTYLQARYSGDNQTAVVDLLVASFDVLTNVLMRKESEQTIKTVRSFICNKIPIQLSILSGFIDTAANLERFVQQAFGTITMDALPPISDGSAEIREKLKHTRLEFLQACVLHSIISEAIVGQILQEQPLSLPRITKHTKESLNAKHGNSVAALEPLIDDLDGMLGNTAAIASHIVDVLNNLCTNKDTMALKNLCNMLIRKISTIDIVMQYTHPTNLLLPLCLQLNEWNHDQDQVEFAPSYEEFASILLFVFVLMHRYGLTKADIGLPDGDNFVASLLQDSGISKLPKDLTEEQNNQLSKWIEGLYATDEQGESSGIGDDVMRPCPPQAFYQLVPTLFEQSVLACKAKSLTMKTFKGGLELLVEPFLLPSLVGGLSWIIKHSWEDHGDADILLQVLDKLLKASSSSQETNAMHKAILGIIAKPLSDSLQNLIQRRPEKKEVDSLLKLLKPYMSRQRTMQFNAAELEEWNSRQGTGFAKQLQIVIREQVAWASSVGPTPPPKYTHKLFAVGCEVAGVSAVLDALIAELREQTNLGNGSLALDVCTALVSAPLPCTVNQLVAAPTPSPNQNGAPSVREELRFRVTDVHSLLQTPNSDAEALVRLNRRVVAQVAAAQVPQLPLALPMQNEATDQIMADLGLTDGDLGTNGADSAMDVALGAGSGAEFTNPADLTSSIDPAMDLANVSAPGLNSTVPGSSVLPADQSLFDDLNLDMTQPVQNPDGTQLDGDNLEEDIFAGLDVGDFGDDFNFS